MQRKKGMGGDIVMINSHQFVALKAIILQTTLHHDIKYDNLTLAQFQRAFNGWQGFTIEFEGSNIRIPSQWKRLVEHAKDVYLYGPPLHGSRQYDLLFRKKSDRVKIKTIFYKMS